MEDYQRRYKLGMLVVALGIAPEQEVFPKGLDNSVPLRPVSPGNTGAPVRPPATPAAINAGAPSEMVKPSAPKSAPIAQPSPAVVSTLPPTPAVSKATAPKVSLPPVAPHPKVDDARNVLLKHETNIHNMLQTIEETRETYLQVAPPECTKEMESVVRCYEHFNRGEAKLISKKSKNVSAPNVLQCAPFVDALSTCASKLASALAAAAAAHDDSPTPASSPAQ